MSGKHALLDIRDKAIMIESYSRILAGAPITRIKSDLYRVHHFKRPELLPHRPEGDPIYSACPSAYIGQIIPIGLQRT
jgi:hypothetical protein